MKRLLIALSLLACERNDVASEARQFALEMGLNVRGVSCSSTDSDGDGYTSCTLNVGGDTPEIMRIECQLWAPHYGCKVAPDMKVIQKTTVVRP